MAFVRRSSASTKSPAAGAVRVHLASDAKWLVSARDRREDLARVAVALSIALVWLGGRSILSLGTAQANLMLGAGLAAVGFVLSVGVLLYSRLIRLQVPAFILGTMHCLLAAAVFI